MSSSRSDTIQSTNGTNFPKGVNIPAAQHIAVLTGTSTTSGNNILFSNPTNPPPWLKFGANNSEVLLAQGQYILSAQSGVGIGTNGGPANSYSDLSFFLVNAQGQTQLKNQRNNLYGYGNGYVDFHDMDLIISQNGVDRITCVQSIGGGATYPNSIPLTLRIAKIG